jgi:hypothetical protein
LTEPVTEKRTMMPDLGFPNWSLTVAVTQCWVPTVFESAGGLSVSVLGGPVTQVLVALEKQPQAGTKAWIVFVTFAVVLVKVNVACPAGFVTLVPPAGAGVPPPLTENWTN